jgi:hypothetical protein
MAGEIRIDRVGGGVVATITAGPRPTAWTVSVMISDGDPKPGAASLSVTLSDGLLSLCTTTPQKAAERWEAIRSRLLEGPSAEAVAAELARAAAAAKACLFEGPALVRFALLVALQVDPKTAGLWSRMKAAGQA